MRYLAGDHHIHTVYSADALYHVDEQCEHAVRYGLDWLVITDHGSRTHARIGVDRVHADIRAARDAYPGLLVFQGLEWNVPAGHHATVFVAPGPDEVTVLAEFERSYDAVVNGWSDGGPGWAAYEAHALAGLEFLAAARAAGRIGDALMLANHPSALGMVSPHQLRDWRDTAPEVAVGMEGAPGHQAAAIPGRGDKCRGNYHNGVTPRSFPDYPAAAYRTYGGFDWMTATVGGLWDALLAEGRPWWITANSDIHGVHDDTRIPGSYPAGVTFETAGRLPPPVDGGVLTPENRDFWPGYYSRTHVGATAGGYLDVMAGLRAGRVWVDHGALLDGIDVTLAAPDGTGPATAGGTGVATAGGTGAALSEAAGRATATLGGRLRVRRGTRLELTVTVRPARRPNHHGDVPRLARVDVIRGVVAGAAADRDGFTAPDTAVVRSFEPGATADPFTVRYRVVAEESFYLRLRGTDGNRGAPGPLGAHVDPAGPAVDLDGDADPWTDLWFYTNPVFVDVF